MHVKYHSPQQEHQFGFPYQLGHHDNADSVENAMLMTLPVRASIPLPPYAIFTPPPPPPSFSPHHIHPFFKGILHHQSSHSTSPTSPICPFWIKTLSAAHKSGSKFGHRSHHRLAVNNGVILGDSFCLRHDLSAMRPWKHMLQICSKVSLTQNSGIWDDLNPGLFGRCGYTGIRWTLGQYSSVRYSLPCRGRNRARIQTINNSTETSW